MPGTVTLSRADRCERCGAAAAVRIETRNLGTFLFCAHHGRQHVRAIPDVIHVHDETMSL